MSHHSLTASLDISLPASSQSNTTATPSPAKPPTLPIAPISELVHEFADTFTTCPDPFANLHSSRHNPDFRIRNQHKILKAATVLSDFQLHLRAAHRAEDQATLNALYAQITRFGEGLESLAQGLGERIEGVKVEGEDGGLRETMSVGRKEDWWNVAHGKAAEEGEMHDLLSSARVKAAKIFYEKTSLATVLSSDGEDVTGEHGCVLVEDEACSESREGALASNAAGRGACEPDVDAYGRNDQMLQSFTTKYE